MAIYEDDGQTVDIREQFVYHNAGLDGLGGSSYIDDVVLRDRDTTGNGTLDERVKYFMTGTNFEYYRNRQYSLMFGRSRSPCPEFRPLFLFR